MAVTLQKKEISHERQAQIEGLVNDLEIQAQNGEPANIVSIGGKVRFPGRYPLSKVMKVSDLIQAAGGLEESAYRFEAEMTSRTAESGKQRKTSHHILDLSKNRQGELQDNLTLQPHDHINIRRLPQWNEKETITLEGEVRFPGEYPISQGETLAQVLTRAGGLTPYAYPSGALFSRAALREKERKENQAMASRLEKDLASLTMEKLNSDPTQNSSLDYISQILQQIRDVKPLGRLSIDLEQIMVASTVEQSGGLELKSGDRLVIPQKPVSVTTVGEIFYPSSHMYTQGVSADEYVQLSGGFTQNADKKRLYIVHANGQVEPASQGAWFRMESEGKIEAGDTIVVPLDADRMKPLTLFTNIADIAAKIAMATANLIAIGSM